ncbi:hypothetical protein GCM10010412_099690 [Nonomuraea recticatena]|uniref:Uncharacterized protein n=1 Tax=Nonomuraea recticatena TaxID=46178 RepID=A0ABP6FU84_9ACTN
MICDGHAADARDRLIGGSIDLLAPWVRLPSDAGRLRLDESIERPDTIRAGHRQSATDGYRANYAAPLPAGQLAKAIPVLQLREARRNGPNAISIPFTPFKMLTPKSD